MYIIPQIFAIYFYIKELTFVVPSYLHCKKMIIFLLQDDSVFLEAKKIARQIADTSVCDDGKIFSLLLYQRVSISLLPVLPEDAYFIFSVLGKQRNLSKSEKPTFQMPRLSRIGHKSWIPPAVSLKRNASPLGSIKKLSLRKLTKCWACNR